MSAVVRLSARLANHMPWTHMAERFGTNESGVSEERATLKVLSQALTAEDRMSSETSSILEEWSAL